MTACVNRKHTKKVAAVVTASLVGALSLGVAPVAAMATDSVDLQFAEGTEFSEGTLNGLSANGYHINDNDGDGVLDITMDNASKLSLRIDADSFTPAGSNKTYTFNQADSDFSMRLYHADEDGNPVGAAVSNFTITTAGNYAVVVEALAGSEYAGQVYLTQLEVKGVALPDVTAFEGVNTNDESFIFTGSALDVNFKVAAGSGDFINAAGDKLVEGVDYTVSYTLGGKAVDAVEGIGTYTATLTGLGAYAGSSAQASVTVTAFDLATTGVAIQVDPFVGEAPKTPSRVYYYDSTNDTLTYLDPSLVGIAVQGDTVNADGSYTFDVTANADELKAGNIQISSPVTTTGVKVAKPVTFKYAGANLEDSYTLVAADGQTFSTAAITATNGSSVVPCAIDHIVANGEYYYATDSDFNDAVNALATGVPGTYEIVVGSCDTTDFNYGGAKAFTVTIYADAVDADAQLYVYHAGDAKAITSYSKLYDGTAVTASEFTVGGKGIDSTKLNVVLTDSEGRVIDKAVAAGEYKLVVTSDYYLLSGTTELPITIEKVDLTALVADKLELWNDIAGQEYLPYVPGAASNRVNTAWSIVENLGLTVNDEKLPENLDIRVQYNDEGEWTTVGSFDDFGEGEYRVVVAVADSAASNYVLPEGETSVTIEFTVSRKGMFSDVQPEMWYFEAVEQAAKNGYVHGDSGATTFRPEATIKRGEVAVVLYNMSGQDGIFSDNENDSDYYEENKGWKTGFDDVDGTAYYAKAITWAKKAGVINGDAGTKNFRPDDTVTSEEFAAMLANYAAKVNGDKTVAEADAASLEGVKGAEGVSEWAQKSVAWAVEQEIMGNNGADLDAKGSIQRARVAAMAVNYQPEAKTRPEAR